MVDDIIDEFASFLADVNPSDFLSSDAAETTEELLAFTTNRADMAEAVERIQSFLTHGETEGNSRLQVLAAAVPLAQNENLDIPTAAAVMGLFIAGIPQIGLLLADNCGLSEQNYLFLARHGNTELRTRLAENPCVGSKVIAFLLTDENDMVVLRALDNRNCSRAMTYLAKPEQVEAWSRLKAMQVHDILKARTEEDFASCASPEFDARLMEAYAINAYSPEDLIRELVRYPTVAGEMIALNLAENYYRFQR